MHDLCNTRASLLFIYITCNPTVINLLWIFVTAKTACSVCKSRPITVRIAFFASHHWKVWSIFLENSKKCFKYFSSGLCFSKHCTIGNIFSLDIGKLGYLAPSLTKITLFLLWYKFNTIFLRVNGSHHFSYIYYCK